MSSGVYLFFTPCGHEPPTTLQNRFNPHLSFQRRRFPILRYAKRPDFALYAIDLLFFPPLPLHVAPSRFPNTIRFGPAAAHSDERPRPQKSCAQRRLNI